MLNFLTVPAGALAILVSLAGSPRSPLPRPASFVRADSVTPALLDSAEYTRLRARMRREYPTLMWDAGVSGEVLVRFVVGADGTVDPRTVVVLRSTDYSGLFVTAAQRALRPVRFHAATRDGVAVPATLEATFTFRLLEQQRASFLTVPGA